MGHNMNFGTGGNKKSYGKILMPVNPISERMDIISIRLKAARRLDLLKKRSKRDKVFRKI